MRIDGTVPGQTGHSRDRRDSPGTEGTVPGQGHCGTDPQPDSYNYLLIY